MPCAQLDLYVTFPAWFQADVGAKPWTEYIGGTLVSMQSKSNSESSHCQVIDLIGV